MPRRLLAAAVVLGAVAVPALAAEQGLLGRTTVETTIVGASREDGFGELSTGPGEPYTVREDLAAAAPDRATRRRSLLYAAQLTDFQLSDEESPARVEFLDSSADQGTPFGAAWRPHEAFVAHMTEMAVRQVNAFAAASPVSGAKMDFALTTGDSADSQQRNETEAVVRLLDGGTVVTNSGSSDPARYTGPCAGVPVETEPRYTGVQDGEDFLPGSGDDYWDPEAPAGQFAAFPVWPGLMDRAQQPFAATGLVVPSYVTFGNHDALVQGNQAANPTFTDIATGCLKPVASVPGTATPVRVPPDPERVHVTKPQYKALHARGVDGHGFNLIDPDELAASNGAAGYYDWSPKPGFRFIATDTVSEGGVAGPSANGNFDDPQFRWIRRTLQEAQAAGELVVLFGHHPPRSLNSPVADEVAGQCGAEPVPGCDLDPRRSTPVHDGDDYEALLKQFRNVIALVSGHTHEHKVTPVERADGTGFWEIETAAEIDFPHQNRLLEVLDNADGTLSIFGTVLDHAGPLAAPAPGTPAARMSTEDLASIGRLVGYNDPQSPVTADTGETRAGGSGLKKDRNVELLLRDPRAGANPASPPKADPVCRPGGDITAASASPRGRGATFAFRSGSPVRVDVFQHAARGVVVGERLVARFGPRTRSVRWDGRANRRGRVVRDGVLSVRFRAADGSVRRVALRRSRGRLSRARSFDAMRPCRVVKAAKLERPVFGGRRNRALGIAVRVAYDTPVTVRVMFGTRTVRNVTRFAQAGRYVRFRLPSERIGRGVVRVVVTAAGDRVALAARRL